MRYNSRFEMMRAVGAKAVASVEMAVPPTMVAGELSVEISEGETSGEDFLRRRLFGHRRLTTPSGATLASDQEKFISTQVLLSVERLAKAQIERPRILG